MIERYRAVLLKLLMVLSAMVRVQMKRPAYNKAIRELRILEAAVRRLIVIAAQDVVTAPRGTNMDVQPSSLPKTARQGECFPLFDRRKQFQRAGFLKTAPQIRSFETPAIQKQHPPTFVNASALIKRLNRTRRALERLPYEAGRLARWRMRPQNRLRRPMRPGYPPGFARRRRKERSQILLRKLHQAAQWALAPDTG